MTNLATVGERGLDRGLRIMGCGLHRTGEANRPYRCTFETECALCSHVRAQAKLLRIGASAALSLDWTPW